MITEAPVHVCYNMTKLCWNVILWLGNGWVGRCRWTNHLFTNDFDSCWRSRLQVLLLLQFHTSFQTLLLLYKMSMLGLECCHHALVLLPRTLRERGCQLLSTSAGRCWRSWRTRRSLSPRCTG